MYVCMLGKSGKDEGMYAFSSLSAWPLSSWPRSGSVVYASLSSVIMLVYSGMVLLLGIGCLICGLSDDIGKLWCRSECSKSVGIGCSRRDASAKSLVSFISDSISVIKSV